MSLPRRTTAETLLARRLVEPIRGCWLWLGAIDSCGYGRLTVDGRLDGAHRAAYRMWVGPIPVGMCVCHTCDTPRCINPEHLWLGTRKDNLHDSSIKGRKARFAARGERQGCAKLTDANVIAIREATARGETSVTLAHTYGVSNVDISRIVRGLNWTHVGGPISRNRKHWTARRPDLVARGAANGAILHPETLKRGEDNPASKLTEEKVREIRRRVEAGETKRAVARDMGVTDVLVGRVVRRKIWRHVA